MLAAAAPRYFAAGLTTIGDPQVSSRELGIYREAHRRGVPGPRIVAMPLSHQLDELLGDRAGRAVRRRPPPDRGDEVLHGRRDHRGHRGVQRGPRAGPRDRHLLPRARGVPGAHRPRPRGRLAARGPHDGRPRVRPRPRRLRGRVPGVARGGPAAQGRARDVPDAGPAPPDGVARRDAGDPARLDPRARQRLEGPARRPDPRGDAAARAGWTSGSARRSAPTRSSRATARSTRSPRRPAGSRRTARASGRTTS